MSIYRHVVGIVCELLTIRQRYSVYVQPRLISETKDKCGYVVQQIIKASNQYDATRHIGSVSGKSVVATRIGNSLWNVHTE